MAKHHLYLETRSRRPGLGPWIGKIPGGGHGNPLQYSCLENPTDRGAWWARVHRVAKSRTRLSDQAHTQGISKQGFHGGGVCHSLRLDSL